MQADGVDNEKQPLIETSYGNEHILPPRLPVAKAICSIIL